MCGEYIVEMFSVQIVGFKIWNFNLVVVGGLLFETALYDIPLCPSYIIPRPIFSVITFFHFLHFSKTPSLKHYYSTKPSLGQGCECKCIWINVCSVVQIFLTKKLFRSVVSFYLLKSFQALEVLSFDRDLTFSRFCFPSISSCRFCLKHLFLYSKAGNEKWG